MFVLAKYDNFVDFLLQWGGVNNFWFGVFYHFTYANVLKNVGGDNSYCKIVIIYFGSGTMFFWGWGCCFLLGLGGRANFFRGDHTLKVLCQ